MTFQNLLNQYMLQCSCTGKELSRASGVAPSVISRYRNGTHTPEPEADQWRRLAHGLGVLARAHGLAELTQERIEREFYTALTEQAAQAQRERELFHRNLHTLLSEFDISNSKLSQSLRFDRSHITRIRSGERTPRDIGAFSLALGHLLADQYASREELKRLWDLIGEDYSRVEGVAMVQEATAQAVFHYLSPDSRQAKTGMGAFLQDLDTFDLHEYARAIHLDRPENGLFSAQSPALHLYTGLKEMMQAQLDFNSATFLSPCDDPVTLFSELPITEMAEDSQFPKKWLLGLADLLNKGLKLNVIHDVSRPFSEMMLGLKFWIPMYMTGQISPYYLPTPSGGLFRRLFWVSGAAALTGGCVAGQLQDGTLLLTSQKNQVEVFQAQASQLLDRAQKLLDIYTVDRQQQINSFRTQESDSPGFRQAILSSLPLYTITDELAGRICDRHGVPPEQQGRILSYIHQRRKEMEHILTHSDVTDCLPLLEEEEYRQWPVSLSLSGIFYEQSLHLTYGEYHEHKALCNEYAASHPRYTCRWDEDTPFRNIQIYIRKGKHAVISKNTSPAIHFVIRHPRMLKALEHFVNPLTA